MGKVALLYTSHFLSAWNSRMFQFGSVLFLAAQFPGTLFPVSLYALASSLPGALFAKYFGTYIDHNDRLKVVRHAIMGQRAAVVAACLLFLFPVSSKLMLALLAILGGIENSWSIIVGVSVERDWVVVVCGANRDLLNRVNARMRSIDLFCKLLGPAAIGFVDSFDHRIAIELVLAMSAISVGIEYLAIARVYRAEPALASRAVPQLDADIREAEGRLLEEPVVGYGTTADAEAALGAPSAPTKFSFWRHPLMLVAVAEALAYITVLAFSGQMIAYLLNSGMSVRTVTYFRTGSVVVELSSTLFIPRAIKRFGPLRAACSFVDFQWLTLLVTSVIFALTSNPLSSFVLSLGVAVSRVGLWGFDLSSQVIIQDGVDESVRGQFSTYERALQNWCMIFLFTVTMIFHDPRLFVFPVMLSVLATGMTMVFINYFMYTNSSR